MVIVTLPLRFHHRFTLKCLCAATSSHCWYVFTLKVLAITPSKSKSFLFRHSSIVNILYAESGRLSFSLCLQKLGSVSCSETCLLPFLYKILAFVQLSFFSLSIGTSTFHLPIILAAQLRNSSVFRFITVRSIPTLPLVHPT